MNASLIETPAEMLSILWAFLALNCAIFGIAARTEMLPEKARYFCRQASRTRRS